MANEPTTLADAAKRASAAAAASHAVHVDEVSARGVEQYSADGTRPQTSPDAAATKPS